MVCMHSFSSLLLMLFVFGSITHESILKELPKDILGDLLSIIVEGAIQLTGNCTGAIESGLKTEYWLYTRTKTYDYVKVDIQSNINNHKPTKFLLHGWSWDANTIYIQQLKDAYLKRYDANIIAVNWGPYAMQNYQSAYCAARGVAENFASFLCKLHYKLNISLSDVHIVGHSMGAQIAGITGSRVIEECGIAVGRITGLDPAGPLFTGLSSKNRLDKTDALFVDVIHTSQGQFGYTGNCGHIDFYPNCGYFQNGCMSVAFKQKSNNILSFLLEYISCNHRRSCDYFQESILGSNFRAVPCIGCGLPTCAAHPFHLKEAIMGEDCLPFTGEITQYVLETKSTPPYAKE